MQKQKQYSSAYKIIGCKFVWDEEGNRRCSECKRAPYGSDVCKEHVNYHYEIGLFVDYYPVELIYEFKGK